MDYMNFSRWLSRRYACGPAMSWVTFGRLSADNAWKRCATPEWLIWGFAQDACGQEDQVDRQMLVARLQAERVLALVEPWSPDAPAETLEQIAAIRAAMHHVLALKRPVDWRRSPYYKRLYAAYERATGRVQMIARVATKIYAGTMSDLRIAWYPMLSLTVLYMGTQSSRELSDWFRQRLPLPTICQGDTHEP